VQSRTKKPKKSVKKQLYGPFEDVEAAYLDNIELFGDRYILLDYGALVASTEMTARALAARIGLDWHPSLVRQTFNGMSIRPNSSFQDEDLKGRQSILTR
jgi:hypothetical protein